MSTVYGGIREEGAIVGDRNEGSCYVLGVTGGWRVHGARKRGESRNASWGRKGLHLVTGPYLYTRAP